MNDHQEKRLLARRLAALRQEKGSLQREVAEAIGIQCKHYAAIEQGRIKPNIIILGRLREYYCKVSIDEIIGVTKEPV